MYNNNNNNINNCKYFPKPVGGKVTTYYPSGHSCSILPFLKRKKKKAIHFWCGLSDCLQSNSWQTAAAVSPRGREDVVAFSQHVQHLLSCTDDENMTAGMCPDRLGGWSPSCALNTPPRQDKHIFMLFHDCALLRQSPNLKVAYLSCDIHTLAAVFTPCDCCSVCYLKIKASDSSFMLQSCTTVRESRIFNSLLLWQSAALHKKSFISRNKVSLFSTGSWKLHLFERQISKSVFHHYYLSIFCCNIYIIWHQKLFGLYCIDCSNSGSFDWNELRVMLLQETWTDSRLSDWACHTNIYG